METAASYTNGASADNSQSLPAAAESAATQDASAVNSESTQAAESGVTETTEGESTTTESAEATEEKKKHNKTLEERLKEVEEKSQNIDKTVQARLAEAKRLEEQQKAAQPDYVPVDYDAYDLHIAKLIKAENQIQADLTLDPENPAELVRMLRKVQAERQKLEKSFEANEAKRTEFEAKQQLTQKEQQVFQQKQSDIGAAVAGIAETYGLAPEVVDAGVKYIDATFKGNPALQQKFNAIVDHKSMYQGFSGPQAAVDWAFSYAQENMGKAATANRDKREAGKELNPAASGSDTTGVFGKVDSFDDLMKLPSAQINQFAKEHPQKFENLKQKRFK